jgi:hypothetical protein
MTLAHVVTDESGQEHRCADQSAVAALFAELRAKFNRLKIRIRTVAEDETEQKV